MQFLNILTSKKLIFTTKLKDKKLSLWDIGGQDKLRVYWNNFFHNVKILAFVVDASDRFENFHIIQLLYCSSVVKC